MLSTLYADAEVPESDGELMARLRPLLPGLDDERTATMYRFAIANHAGAFYRLVILFGESKRKQAIEALRQMGYRRGGPQPERGLDAVFLQPLPQAA
jgi:hypothetical protein